MTHDSKRHGTTTLFAALNVLTSKLIGTCQRRHRHQEWLRFLTLLDQHTPPTRPLHLIGDNYAIHEHPTVLRWLKRHPRFHVIWPKSVRRYDKDVASGPSFGPTLTGDLGSVKGAESHRYRCIRTDTSLTRYSCLDTRFTLAPRLYKGCFT